MDREIDLPGQQRVLDLLDEQALAAKLDDPDAFSPQIDCALAAENMMLAARSLGIGSCWIGLASPLAQVPAVMNELGVPAEYRLVGSLIFGLPAKLNQKAPKRNGDVILNWID